ncbi:MAG: hypothetical protein IT499_01505 [Rubrivivax sp.]|nr:hypothetical protein [Rubrivivax sp.]
MGRNGGAWGSCGAGTGGGPRAGRCTAYVATALGALLAALVLALTTAPALAAGPVRAEALRRASLPSLQSADAGALLAVLRFLRDTPGQEALGIAYAAAYLRAADAQRIDAEPFDALGTMAERLALRASGAAGTATAAAAAQIDVVGAYGVRFVTTEREGHPQLCYDGEAFKRVLTLRPGPEAQARAVLALTRPDCVDPLLTPAARVALDAWRADLLDLPWPRGYDALPALVKNRLHLRRAGLWAARAHQFSRLNRPAPAAAERALAELANVNKAGFTDLDHAEYAEAAIRVGAVRWAAVPQLRLQTTSAVATTPTGMIDASAHGLRLVVRAGAEAGQSCVQLLAAEGRSAPSSHGSNDIAAPRLLAERCTFGTIWPRSLAVRPAGDALVLAVQPRDGWSELWVFRPDSGAGARPPAGAQAPAWRIDVLPPAAVALR